MSKDPAFLFYFSDFVTDTLTMTWEQRGKYLFLIGYQFQNGHLSEEEMIAIIGKRDSKIFSKFVEDENGLFYNEEMEKVFAQRRSYCESRRKNAINPKQKQTQKAYAEHMQSICEPYAEHMENENRNIDKDKIKNKNDIENKSKSKNKNKNNKSNVYINSIEYTEKFNKFWSAYPKKVKKVQAFLVFKELDPSDELLDEMLKALETQQNSREWTEEEGRYIPQAKNWLANEGWTDELTPRKEEPVEGQNNGSFETDEFFEASLRRTLEKYENLDKKGKGKENDN